MDLYCWAGVAILLIIGAIALMYLWSKSNTQGDSIKWLEQERESMALSIMTAKDEAIGVAKIAVAEAKAAKVEFNLHRTGVYEPKVKGLEESIGIVDESVGLLEKRVSEMDGLHSALVNDGVEFFRAKNDFTLTCDRHEKRLNDQMTHVTGIEKKVAVLSAKVDMAQEHALLELKTLEIFHELVRRGVFIAVEDEPKVSRRADPRRGKRKRVA